MDGLGQTVRDSKRFGPNRPKPILDSFPKPSGRFGPKPSGTGLVQTVRDSKWFGPNRPKPILDGFPKPSGTGSGRFGPKRSRIFFNFFLIFIY
jgi:hypothetical protein